MHVFKSYNYVITKHTLILFYLYTQMVKDISQDKSQRHKVEDITQSTQQWANTMIIILTDDIVLHVEFAHERAV